MKMKIYSEVIKSNFCPALLGGLPIHFSSSEILRVSSADSTRICSKPFITYLSSSMQKVITAYTSKLQM